MAPELSTQRHSTQVTITNLPGNCTTKALVKLLDDEEGYHILRLKLKELSLVQYRVQPPIQELVAFVDFASKEQAEEACGVGGEQEKMSLGPNCLLNLRLGNSRKNSFRGSQKRPLKLNQCSLHLGTLVAPRSLGVLWHASQGGLDLEFDFSRGVVRWYFQMSCRKLNTARGSTVDVLLTSHLRDIKKVVELRQGVEAHPPSVPLLILLWKAPRVSYRLPAKEIYRDPMLEERHLWYDDDEDPYIRTTDPSPNQSMGGSLAYLVSALPSQFKACREILHRLQHRSVPDPPADISVTSCKLPKAFGIGPVSLGVKTPEPLDFRLAFLTNALVMDGVVSEMGLDTSFFRHLEGTPVEISERALEKMRFTKSSDTPLAEPAKQLRMLIDAELADSASDLCSDTSSDYGSTPCSVLDTPTPPVEQLSDWHLIEHRFFPPDPNSFSGPLPRSADKPETISINQTPPKPLRPRRPYNPLQPNLHNLQLSSKPLQLSANPLQEVCKPLQTVLKPLPPASRLVPVRQLAITPLRAYLAGPYMELGNRVLRRRPELTDRFLRVFFTEEDLGHLGNAALRVPIPSFLSKDVRVKPQDTRLMERIGDVCKNGFTLAGRRYFFCGSSTNQTRERSAWFFAPTDNVSVKSIWQDMGDFTIFTNRAKLAARMALCFSTSTRTLKVPPTDVYWLPDVTRNGHNFSDGVGKISPSAAAEVARILGLSHVPSAFQVRYAGCKGMVVADPTCGRILNLRDSMRKFDSAHQDLEVVSWSSFSPSFLNRQIITLLVALGVPDTVFEELQDAQLKRIRGMITDPEAAMQVLQKSCSGDGHQALQMLRAGFRPQTEPYLRSMLGCIADSQLTDLRSKARIFVEQGAWCYGVMDETGSLEEGQIFLQLQGSEEATPTVITGLSIVAKNPCLHPGDVRVLRATRVPELENRALVNVVVFSQKGERPEADKASGSDLDGDIYFVSYDPRLVPPGGESAEPMNYAPQTTQDAKKRLTPKDAVDHFLNSIRTDPIGQISNAHVVHADLSPRGAWDDSCLRLAELAAVAVDFPKTGVPAIMPPDLKPKKYPSYMEKKNGEETYESTKILGRLYKMVARIAGGADEHDNVEGFESVSARTTFDPDALDRDVLVRGFEARLKQATRLRDAYEWELAKLMQRNGIKEEAEVTIGHVLHLADFQKRRKLSEVRDRVRFHYTDLKKDFRKWLELIHQWPVEQMPVVHNEAPPSLDDPGCKLCAQEDQRPCAEFRVLASACYYACYGPQRAQSGPHWWRGSKMYSFAWLAADVLATMKGQL